MSELVANVVALLTVALLRRALASFFGRARIGLGWLNAAEPAKSDFQRISELPFRHLLPARGTPLLNDAKTALQATFARVFGP